MVSVDRTNLRCDALDANPRLDSKAGVYLRDQLNSILGFSELLFENASLHAKGQRYMVHIRRSGMRLLQLANDAANRASLNDQVGPWLNHSARRWVIEELNVILGFSALLQGDETVLCPEVKRSISHIQIAGMRLLDLAIHDGKHCESGGDNEVARNSWVA